MKKPVKIALWTLGGLLALAVVLLLALPLWIGPVVTCVANRVVPGYTGTDFKLEGFSLNPYTGKIRVEGLTLANPEGFDEKTAASVRSIRIDLDTGSLFTKKIHISDITIDDPFVSYVYDGAGSNNFERILAHLDKSETGEAKTEGEAETGAAEGETAEENKGEGKKVVIDRLAINGTWVKYRMIKLPIPIPTLTNIGGGKDGAEAEGATPAEVQETIWNSIKDKFAGVGGLLNGAAGALGAGSADALKSATNLLGGATDGVKGAGQAATQAVGDGAKAVATGAGDAVKDAGKAVGDGAKAAADGAKDALKKVGNLFGK